MTYKHAAAGLDQGGGKAVILGDPRTLRTDELILAYGRFVDGLAGRYVTAEDVGTTQADMDLIRTVTPARHGRQRGPRRLGRPVPGHGARGAVGHAGRGRHDSGETPRWRDATCASAGWARWAGRWPTTSTRRGLASRLPTCAPTRRPPSPTAPAPRWSTGRRPLGGVRHLRSVRPRRRPRRHDDPAAGCAAVVGSRQQPAGHRRGRPSGG